MLWNWITEHVRAATAKGVALGLADVGMLPDGAGPDQVRGLLAPPPAVEDKPAGTGRGRPAGGGR